MKRRVKAWVLLTERGELIRTYNTDWEATARGKVGQYVKPCVVEFTAPPRKKVKR